MPTSTDLLNQFYHRITAWISLIIVLFLFYSVPTLSQTTGKISGKATDAETGEPLIGANVLIVGASRGAATDIDGEFYIINVSPGNYKLRFQMVGYEALELEDLRVSINRTTTANVKLKQTAITVGEVVVKADRVTQKDQTGSIRNISDKEISFLPVETINDVVALQPGVVAGHFRGGRTGEVLYLLDGIPVNENFSSGNAINVEKEIVRDLEVISGTFSAEYGQAMSGVVNVVTKDGGNSFSGSVSRSMSNYYTSHNDIFIGLKNSEINRNQDYKFQLSGPVIPDELTFLFNVRYQDNKNHLNGIHRFDVNNYSDFSSSDSSRWYTKHTGGNEYVPMNFSKNLSLFGKITSKLSEDIKVSLLYDYGKNDYEDYNHMYKYNPYGSPITHTISKLSALQLNHIISKDLFYEAKFSNLYYYFGNYPYEDPFDSRYVHDAYLRSTGPGFYTGGQSKNHNIHKENKYSVKVDLSWQANKHHLFKVGILGNLINLINDWHTIRNAYEGTGVHQDYFYFDTTSGRVVFPYYKPAVYGDTTIYADVYSVWAKDFGAYIQDKMEYDELVINYGLRFDYFNPSSVYPSQIRNPGNLLSFPDNPERMSQYLRTKPTYQLSPRIGLAYELGQYAVLHFGYGHFFQTPPLYALYQNHAFLVGPTSYSTVMGNTELKPQKTVQYEVGLGQELITGMNLGVAVFYKDIYNLLSTKVVTTYNQIAYGMYTNKDYGNVKGLEVKYDFRFGNFAAYLNYTLQYATGNADNPTQTFTRAGNSMDPISTLIPLAWDQRHTLNLTLSYSLPRFSLTVTGYYNSGVPFTWSPPTQNRLADINLYPNNSIQPSTFDVDLYGYYNLLNIKPLQIELTLNIYNLFDRLNARWVNSQTGQPYTAIVQTSDLTSHHSDFNSYYDIIRNPDMYSVPRQIKLGLRANFDF
ncbi:MAG: TonB-dependent receptor [Bacteroidetes bacterium]|nr:TonB-dependent receptor [Bacteroidota bacterium]MBU2583997.1 TonB-dependent receptor [Bacteroidota bacterium]